jgi:hypothetical protein
VEGLDNLQVKELNVAKNPLGQLGNLLKLKTLKSLNVSATFIGSFKVSYKFHVGVGGRTQNSSRLCVPTNLTLV